MFDPSEIKIGGKAFLLIWLKKCLNPHENSRLKVISILLTDDFYMGPLLLKNNTNRYNVNGKLCTKMYIEIFRI